MIFLNLFIGLVFLKYLIEASIIVIVISVIYKKLIISILSCLKVYNCLKT